ncbi:hypothetical protein [Roseofilum casamattae]|uniref:Uncharacterized protein n=1 Tax=Roseofilum casamattae BLCC-M143 TaxID=3022442 RepID=A0ABT7C0B7_9CYAN|nr:hypothetical protein [Roseofilum casamattae]MDJ1184887.1 hypothetical protein [Roseofilum casamattae BLCC-M143]
MAVDPENARELEEVTISTGMASSTPEKSSTHRYSVWNSNPRSPRQRQRYERPEFVLDRNHIFDLVNSLESISET